LILEQLARCGVQVDCYLTATDNRQQVEAVTQLPGAEVILVESVWRWKRWYSQHPLTAMVTGLGTQALGRRKLTSLLVERHALDSYDAVYQFSTIEVFGRRKDRTKLPPMVFHPSVHAAGELRWMRNERDLSWRCEGWVRPRLVMAWFSLRSRRQRRDIQRAVIVLALSASFGRHLVNDYGIEPSCIRIAPNPIDLIGFGPLPATDVSTKRFEIAIVGRISVRKGLELVVQLSHRLRDLSGTVHMEIVGNPSQWSNYRRLLDTIDQTVASYNGSLSHDDLQKWLPKCDLLLQTAKYEPFGLTVGEALASGVPVVVTTEVGAGEEVSKGCCIRVPPGDLDALEGAVREMVARLRSTAGTEMRAGARSEAERLWSAASVTRPVLAALLQVAGLSTHQSTSSMVREFYDQVQEEMDSE
jgi:glycosyltransferase involved in cell wall biosynthesis